MHVLSHRPGVLGQSTKVEVRIKAPLNTGTGQKSVSLTGSKLAREAPWDPDTPAGTSLAAARGGAGQRVLEPSRVSSEPVRDALFWPVPVLSGAFICACRKMGPRRRPDLSGRVVDSLEQRQSGGDDERA